MKLYYSPGACSLSPHIVAHELGIALELKKVDLRAKQVEDGSDYWKINGKGSVPALEISPGQVLTEGPAIVQYLADLNGGSALIAKAGTMERYRTIEWLNFISTEVHKSFSPLFNKAASADWKEGATALLRKRFDWLSTQLQEKHFLLGENFSVADAYLFVVLNWGRVTGIDLAAWPILADYQARIAARPPVQAAMKAEGLL